MNYETVTHVPGLDVTYVPGLYRGLSGRLEALSFQQALPPVFSLVYPEPGMVVPRLKRELNAFLGVWFRNLKAQGHRLVPERE